ncbi:preprotein translocase subunit SecE [Candidatus Amesbacteria bacterium RIFCSPLOWO2_01_FULL_49_25]|uniref:Protein translocase subunit SecE n=1 Tax=Candidatus Amesbacteria bacterium RIFCSPHIGHO2_01_FULL_48_32b TaxID=1797253 RepID=A0A1F4YE92_9BACT|nr:MAG: preprotein translocase subunit SecE [Candidatus Amesbacteria bacterium RIFCSPHIGHO2_01_FULL_48_32b]OGD07292.1 MAG: preprotein translocase subunit SecE [Candidatus Amesbacteria bacterium RIFCSPLOWO2_01_FULL_49_25]
MNPISYLRESYSELKLVHWPSRQETLKLTLVVIVISVLVASYVGALDLTFTKTLSLIIK